jgi:hypothetical protein
MEKANVNQASLETGSPAKGVMTGGSVTSSSESTKDVTKIIVAVHGIGDQNAFGTLQQVVNQFCSFFDQPAAIPLGSFHTIGQAAFSMPAPFPPELFKQFAFAEVYWAKVPRTVVKEQHTLEEAKAWASTIIERLRLRRKQEQLNNKCQDIDLDNLSSDFNDVDFKQLKVVLKELIETIAILERLSFLADKAGLFTFDLKKLLDDYLGDVQIVTEFETDRNKILEAFNRVMSDVHNAYSKADIYIMAHSEGTVVSFLGLLEAAKVEATRKTGKASWINQVRGFMTFGSPIDKHLILWPSLFPDCPVTETPLKRTPIEWRNYYDKGDPIGFDLNDARIWLPKHNWEGLFNFIDKDDFGFTRYPFPGPAHIGYWTDECVFGHFIQTVIKPEVPPDYAATIEKPHFTAPPQDKKWVKWPSYFLPYVGVFTLLYVAVLVLFKAVLTLNPDAKHLNSDEFVFRSVAAFTFLMFGTMVATRIPHMTRIRSWLYGSWGICLLFAVTYLIVLPTEVRIERRFLSFFDSLYTLSNPYSIYPIRQSFLIKPFAESKTELAS